MNLLLKPLLLSFIIVCVSFVAHTQDSTSNAGKVAGLPNRIGHFYFGKDDTTLHPMARFHKTYKLRSLSEVEQFTQQNHHVPEVPSAVEVEKNSLDLGKKQAPYF